MMGFWGQQGEGRDLFRVALPVLSMNSLEALRYPGHVWYAAVIGFYVVNSA